MEITVKSDQQELLKYGSPKGRGEGFLSHD